MNESLRSRRSKLGLVTPIVLLFSGLVIGCGDSGPPRAPVSGTVTLDGEPLKFGYVVLQPPAGVPNRSEIQSDGSYSIPSETDVEKGLAGAVVGENRVSVYCYEGQRPTATLPAGDVSLGPSLIPVAYTRGGMSGLSIDVPPEGIEGHLIELSSKGP